MKRVRGRRVAFLIASALPLLADDEIAPLGNNTTANQTRHHAAAEQHSAAPNVRPTGLISKEYVDNENDLSARTKLQLVSDKAMPTKLPTPQHLLDSESNWGSLDSLWASSNDSILPFFPLDHEYEMAPFRGASRQLREIVGKEPMSRTTRVEKTSIGQQTNERKNSSYSETNSTASESESPESSDLSHDAANTPSMESTVTSSESNETSAKRSEGADNSKHVAVDYASKSAGAMILDSSANFKGSSNLLNTDRDMYAIVPCAESTKYVVIGLSEDILVKQIVIANYERYSSHMKDIRILSSATAAVGSNDWIDLGTYTTTIGGAQAQTFDLIKPMWARYLKVEFLSHHGNEFYCTVSQISVFGSTVLQGFHEQWDEDSMQRNQTPEESTNNAMTPDGSNAPPHDTDSTDDVHATKQEPMRSDLPLNERIKTTCRPSDVSSVLDCCIMHSRLSCPEEWNFTQTINRVMSSNSSDLVKSGALSWSSRSSKHTPKFGVVANPLKEGRRFRGMLFVKQLRDNNNYFMQGTTLRESDRVGKAVSVWTSRVVSLVDDLIPGLVAAESIADRFLPPSFSSTKETVREKPGDASPTAKADGAVSTDRHVKKTRADKAGSPASDSEGSAPESVISRDVIPAEAILKGQGDSPEMLNELDATSRALAQILQRLPSAQCLQSLNFADFKTSVLKSRTGTGSGSGGGGGSGANMEPVFKKLTDEIRALQANVAVHDQFTHESISCYQRVLLELLMDNESSKAAQEARFRRIENDLRLGVLVVAAHQLIASLLRGVFSRLEGFIVLCGAIVTKVSEECKIGSISIVAGGMLFAVAAFVFVSMACRGRRRQSSFTNLATLCALDMSKRDTTLKLSR
jgi:Sad1 / UNC-like C-terminal